MAGNDDVKMRVCLGKVKCYNSEARVEGGIEIK
jgi:hypothetical protein